MEILRAILMGALLWVFIFFEVSILMFGFELEPGFLYYTLHYSLLTLFIILASLIYFRKHGIKTGLGQGFWLGIILILTGLVLDAIITVPVFVKTYDFFFDIYILTGMLEILVISTVIGIIRK